MRMVWLAMAGILASSSALAQSGERRLSAADLRTDWFGVVMSGVTRDGGQTWSECIEPDGDTLYAHQGRAILRGRMWTEAGDVVCFAYEDSGFAGKSCFSAWVRDGRTQFRAEPQAPGDDVFEVRRVKRNVTSCPRPDALVG